MKTLKKKTKANKNIKQKENKFRKIPHLVIQLKKLVVNS